MARAKPDRPTDTEMEILHLLWEFGPSTVRDVHERLTRRRTAYTTVLTQLQFMHQKGLVVRDDSEKSHVYRAAKTQEQTERSFVKSLIRRSFAGSARSLVMHALSIKKAPREELERLRRLFDELEGPEQ